MSETRRQVYIASAVFMPVFMASILAWVGVSLRLTVDSPATSPLVMWVGEGVLLPVEANSAVELEAYFDQSGYGWLPSPGPTVLAVEVAAIPPDLGALKDVRRKKSLFFRALLPIVLSENNSIRAQRALLVQLLHKGEPSLTREERTWLEKLARWYRVKGDAHDERVSEQLLARVDEIPAELVLAQAANESAWGTSRFAQLGNNLFGMWTFDETEGIVPAQRTKGLRHAVKAYPSVRDSVRAYMRNLNTHRAYETLRKLRKQTRAAGDAINGKQLAGGLLRYSQRGQAYVDELRSMIRSNNLIKVRSTSLRTVENQTRVFLQSARVDGATGG